jgi:hypothetical protein
MRLFVKVRSFLRNLFLSGRVEADLHNEVQSHLELMTAENMRAGMGPEEARRFGGYGVATSGRSMKVACPGAW